MKTVYFVRHGESEANINLHAGRGVFQGERSQLTEKGREQARFIAERCTRLSFDVILTSPAIRAHDTAKEIQKATGKPLEVHEIFVERKVPTSLLGKPRNDPDLRRILHRWYKTCSEGGRVEDGENFGDLKTRVLGALAHLRDRSEKCILIVTHGYFLHMLVALVQLGESLTAKEFSRLVRRVSVGNTGLTQIDWLTEEDNQLFDGSPYTGWVLRVWNDHAHLG